MKCLTQFLNSPYLRRLGHFCNNNYNFFNNYNFLRINIENEIYFNNLFEFIMMIQLFNFSTLYPHVFPWSQKPKKWVPLKTNQIERFYGKTSKINQRPTNCFINYNISLIYPGLALLR